MNRIPNYACLRTKNTGSRVFPSWNRRGMCCPQALLLLRFLLRVPGIAGVVLKVALAFMAGKFENVIIPLVIPPEGEPYGPGPSINSGIFDSRFVLDGVCVNRCVPFDNMQRIRSEIAHHVEPGSAVEIRRIDHECVPFPSAYRISLPQLYGLRQMRGSLRTDDTPGMLRLI